MTEQELIALQTFYGVWLVEPINDCWEVRCKEELDSHARIKAYVNGLLPIVFDLLLPRAVHYYLGTLYLNPVRTRNLEDVGYLMAFIDKGLQAHHYEVKHGS